LNAALVPNGDPGLRAYLGGVGEITSIRSGAVRHAFSLSSAGTSIRWLRGPS